MYYTMSYTYPKGVIRLTSGYIKNHPLDITVMGVNNDLHGGLKVVNTKEELLAIHPDYLIKNYSAALVLNDDGLGNVAFYGLVEKPSNLSSSILSNWLKVKLGGDSVTSALNFKGKVNPGSVSLTDAGDHEVGDFYIIENSSNPSVIDVTGLLQSVATNVYSGDNLIYVTEGYFIHIDKSNDNTSSWDTLNNVPVSIKALGESNELPDHTHLSSDVTLEKVISGTEHTNLQTLLSFILYTDILAATVAGAQDSQLLNFGQLKEHFVTNADSQETILEIITPALAEFYTKSEVNDLLDGKSDVLSIPDLVEAMAGEGHKIFSQEEYTDLNRRVDNIGFIGKIYLISIVSLDDGLVEPIFETDKSNEKHITSVRSTSSSALLSFVFSSTATYSGDYQINGVPFSTVVRIGDSDRFTGLVTLDLSLVDQVIIVGDAEKSIPLIAPEEVVLTATPDVYPVDTSRTHFKNHEEISITIGLSKAITHFEIIASSGINTIEKTAVTPVDSGTGYFSFQVTIKVNYSGGPSYAELNLVPYITENELGLPYSVEEFIAIDGTEAQIEVQDIGYDSGYDALKGSEIAIVEFSAYGATSVFATVGSELSELNLNISDLGAAELTVQRLSGTDVSVPMIITGILDSNGATSEDHFTVEIYTEEPAHNTSVEIIRSGGNTNLYLVVDMSRVRSISGVFSTIGDAYYIGNGAVQIQLPEGTPVGDSIENVSYTAASVSGMEFSKTLQFKIKGSFAYTRTLVYPSLQITPATEVLNANNLIISGEIESSPPFSIPVFYLNKSGADGFQIIGGDIVFNSELFSLGYYTGSDFTVTIEETI
jgi:hypothetical protein